jgi:biotin-(acetyl-CoA carboxylase) ligase
MKPVKMNTTTRSCALYQTGGRGREEMQYYSQKHGIRMVIQQPQSAKPFSVDKINFNVDYYSAQYK